MSLPKSPATDEVEPSFSLANPDWQFLPTARPTVYSDPKTVRLRINALPRNEQKLEKRHFFQRMDAANAYLEVLDATEDLIKRSREIFTAREEDDLVPNILLDTTPEFRRQWRAVVEKEAYRKPPKDVPLDPHLDPPSSDDENMTHFEYRVRKLDLRLKHAHAVRNRLDVRHTIEARKLTEEEEAELIKQAKLAAEEEPEDGIKNAPRANGGIGISSGVFPRTDAYSMFSSLTLENTQIIAIPSPSIHVTVATANHLHFETQFSTDDFRIPNPNSGPRALVPRYSLSYYQRAHKSGGASRPGGSAIPCPDRLTMFVKSRLTGIRHIAFLLPLNGAVLNKSTSHEERERLMLRQLRNAAARRIQRMWHHRTGILVLLQKIRRRKRIEAEKAAALALAIEKDRLEAWNMFTKPSWAPKPFIFCPKPNISNQKILAEEGRDNRKRIEVHHQLPRPKASKTDDAGTSRKYGTHIEEAEEPMIGKVNDQSERKPNARISLAYDDKAVAQNYEEPFKNSFGIVKRWKHLAHTITLHPRHAMTRREWRQLCQDVVQIVAGHIIGTKPKKAEVRARQKLAAKGNLGPKAFTRKRAARMLARLYGRYVLTPDFMSLGYNERASEYWGLVNSKDFARDTHYEPADGIVRSLLSICGYSTSRGKPAPTNTQTDNYHDTAKPDKPEDEDESKDQDEDSLGIMPFGDFARGLIRLCCLNTVDLVSFQVMVVNEGLNKLAAKAELEPEIELDKQQAATEQAPKEERSKPSTLGFTQRRIERLLCRLHQGHDEYRVLLREDHVAGASGYSWAVDQEDMSGIVERSLAKMRSQNEKDRIMGPIDLLDLLLRCPILAWPCIHMQRCLRRRVLGERFWRDFEMGRIRPELPPRVSKLVQWVAKENYHTMSLRHAWAATTKLIQLESLGHHSGTSSPEDGSQNINGSICLIQQCGRRLSAANLSTGICNQCSLKSIGIIASSVGFRVAHRFRERSQWFDHLLRDPVVPVHNQWLLMRDPLTRSNFYYNGETATTRWQLGVMENRLASEENPIKVVDMRPRQRRKKQHSDKKKESKRKGRRRRKSLS